MNPYRVFITFLIIISPFFAKAQKTDTVFHINGNILLGEIKKLDYGFLHFKMDGMGTLKIEQEKIKSLKSLKHFEFTTNHGRYFYGRLDSSNVEGVISINTGYDSIQMHMYQIVEIYPIKNSFWKRTSGKINVGFNYTKASSIGRFNTDLSFNYRNKKTYFSITTSNVQTFNTTDTIDDNTSKYDVQLTLSRQFTGKWAWNVFLTGSQNSELGLDLRMQGGGGATWDIFRSNIQRFSWLNAIAPNVEIAATNDANTVNIEAMSALKYELFKHTNPEMSVSTAIDVYPSLNNWGRYRLDYNLNASIEIINNLFVGIQFYYSFDSNPASEGAANDDYGFTTTLGYSFN